MGKVRKCKHNFSHGAFSSDQMQLQETVDSASSTSSPYREMSLGWTLNG